MIENVYSISKYGNTKFFTKGDKVVASYYHEYESEPNEYNDSKIQRLIDKPFKPVKCGIIVGDAGIKSFWLGKNSMEQYLYVKFKEFFFKKAFPKIYRTQ